jgi:hypothetical protein
MVSGWENGNAAIDNHLSAVGARGGLRWLVMLCNGSNGAGEQNACSTFRTTKRAQHIWCTVEKGSSNEGESWSLIQRRFVLVNC